VKCPLWKNDTSRTLAAQYWNVADLQRRNLHSRLGGWEVGPTGVMDANHLDHRHSERETPKAVTAGLIIKESNLLWDLPSLDGFLRNENQERISSNQIYNPKGTGGIKGENGKLKKSKKEDFGRPATVCPISPSGIGSEGMLCREDASFRVL